MRLNSLFFFISDIFDSYFWNQGNRINDCTLFTSSEDLKKLVIVSEAGYSRDEFVSQYSVP